MIQSCISAQIGGYTLNRPVLMHFSSIDRPHDISPNPVEIGPMVGAIPQAGCPCLLNSLVHQLTREIDVECHHQNNRDLRQAIARDANGYGEMGESGHHYLDGKGYALLGFYRRISRCRGIDLHLHVGNVRYRINRQPLVAIYPSAAIASTPPSARTRVAVSIYVKSVQS